MDKKWLITGAVLGVLVGMLIPRHNPASQVESLDGGQSVEGLRALLVTSDQVWDRKKELVIYGALLNESKSPIKLNRHLYMGSLVRLTIRHRDGELNYTPYNVTIGKPGKEDLVVLNPGEFLGKRFLISRQEACNASVSKAIDRMPSGTVKLQFKYTTFCVVRDQNFPSLHVWDGAVKSNEACVELR